MTLGYYSNQAKSFARGKSNLRLRLFRMAAEDDRPQDIPPSAGYVRKKHEACEADRDGLSGCSATCPVSIEARRDLPADSFFRR